MFIAYSNTAAEAAPVAGKCVIGQSRGIFVSIAVRYLGALLGSKVITPELFRRSCVGRGVFRTRKILLTAMGTRQIDESDLPRAAAPVFKAVYLVNRLPIAGFFRNGQQHGGHGGVVVVVGG